MPTIGTLLDQPAPPLPDLLSIGLATTPDDVAVVSAERQMSWLELDRKATVLASGYLELG